MRIRTVTDTPETPVLDIFFRQVSPGGRGAWLTYVPFLDSAAVVHGYAARSIAVLLRGVDVGAIPAGGRPQVEATIEAIELAGAAWARKQTIAAVGSSEVVEAEVGAQCAQEFSVSQAAVLLNLGERRVRSLAACGLGRKVGSVWVLDAAAVLVEAKKRREPT